MSIREFCRQQRVKESQFYWWQHKLKLGRQELMRKSVGSRGAASFALVSDEAGMTALGLIGSMSFQLAIPRQVALPQSPPQLHQPTRILRESGQAVQSNCSER